MNADGRRWICHSFVVALLSAGLPSSVKSEEFQSPLRAEIERRFSATFDDSQSERIIDSAFPLTREIEKSRGRVQPLKLNFEYKVSAPPDRLEGIDSLPQPTVVERYIVQGFPSGERRWGDRRDDAYDLAPEGRGEVESYSYILAVRG